MEFKPLWTRTYTENGIEYTEECGWWVYLLVVPIFILVCALTLSVLGAWLIGG